MTVDQCNDKSEWDTLVERFHGHPLQLWGWGEVKAKHGWRVDRVVVRDNSGEVVGGAQLLIKRLPRPFPPFVYIPRGPFGGALESETQRQSLVQYSRETYHPLVVSAEPDWVGKLHWKGWQVARQHILLARTATLDLTEDEATLLADMSKKTRQYVRKSAKEGIMVRLAESRDDIDACLAIYKDTAHRAGFTLHGDDYYHDIFAELGQNSPVYLAELEGGVVAFLWPVVTGEVAFELYGGMNDKGQAHRANYFLKWSVIQAMQARGIKRYDVNGLLNDGVTAFKKGFIPEETIMAGTYDKPLSPLYAIWTYALPLTKRAIRAIRKA